MHARLPRLSLLARFSLVSLLVTVLVGGGLGVALERRVEQRGLREAERVAETVALIGVQPRLRAADLAGPLPAWRIAELDAELGGGFLAGAGVERIKLFDRAGRIVYSDDAGIIGTDGNPEHLRVAFAGGVLSQLTRGFGDTGDGATQVEHRRVRPR